MVEFIIQIVITALWCWGFANAFDEDNIFGGLGKIIKKTAPSWFYKPTIGCVKCMPSIHGTIWFIYFHEFDFFLWILFIVAVSGLNTIILNLFPDE